MMRINAGATGRMRGRRARRSAPSRLPRLGWIAILAAFSFGAADLRGNGGTLRLANEPMGDYRVSVFTDPTPVRPDSLDVSVLILQVGVDGVPEDVEVWVESRPMDHGGGMQRVAATRDQADDPRYHAAKFALGHEGIWEVRVEVQGPAGEGSANFQLRARAPGLLGHPLTIFVLALLPLAIAAWWLFREPVPPVDASAAELPRR